MPASPSKPRPPLPGGPYLVVGLARSGAAIARALARRGEEVVGIDAGSPPEAAGLEGEGVEVHLNADGSELLARVNAVVKSPGVPRQAPVIAAALQRGTPVIGELEAAWRMLPNRFVAVTGTNGKTTVTELAGHVWRTAAEPVAVAGNVGTPLAALVDELDPDATVVCESSSFQLEDSEAFAPECGVFLNFAPDHLDRHASLEEYLESKLRIFANQGNDDVAVYNGDEPALEGRDLGGCARRVAFCRGRGGDRDSTNDRSPSAIDTSNDRSPSATSCEVELDAGVIFWADQPLAELSELQLSGPHNADNAMAAAAAALTMGLSREAVAEGLRSFGGVPHRLERVAEIDGVLYVNDSKATNVAAAVAALRSFDGGVRAILGGSLKGGDFGLLAEPVAECCVACYLIGEAAELIAEDLESIHGAGIEVNHSGDLETAVREAAAAADAGEVVLLSPACASFDQYRDYEQRGEHFRALVEEMA